MSHSPASEFVETLEHRRFAEFCDACRHYRYIGLCYGPSGVGKTLSARRYANWDTLEQVEPIQIDNEALSVLLAKGFPNTILCTPAVINTPRSIAAEVQRARSRLHQLAREPVQREQQGEFETRRSQFKAQRAAYFAQPDCLDLLRAHLSCPPEQPPYAEIAQEFSRRLQAIADPTTLILIDEADRLKMASLEAARDIFDRSELGLILIGMPGLEKRLARYAQFYSRIGFVHEFRPLGATEVRQLLDQRWTPAGLDLPPLEEDAVTAIIRVTGGNFRLLHRLLSQAERIARINELSTITRSVVEAARESLVIGQM
jgi:DNA transposition AAA+ family ATPase